MTLYKLSYKVYFDKNVINIHLFVFYILNCYDSH